MEIELISYGDNFVEFSFSGSFSVNRVYRYKSGMTKPYPVHAKIYSIIKKKYQNILDKKFLTCQKFIVRYDFTFNTNQRKDVSNYIKVFEDLVFRYFIKQDDSFVYEIMAKKTHVNTLEKNIVKITWECLDEGQYNYDKIEKIKKYREYSKKKKKKTK